MSDEKHKIDTDAIARAVRQILEAVGEDPEREGLLRTPQRVAKMYEELFAGMNEDPAEHLKVHFTERYDEMVVLRDIPFCSMCEHHLLPFMGKAHVAYLPSQKVAGVSKLARVVESFARRPQVQERLTSQIADALVEHLAPLGAIVVLECEHLCMTIRGAQKPNARTITTAVRGELRESAARAEAMSLIQGPR